MNAQSKTVSLSLISLVLATLLLRAQVDASCAIIVRVEIKTSARAFTANSKAVLRNLNLLQWWIRPSPRENIGEDRGLELSGPGKLTFPSKNKAICIATLRPVRGKATKCDEIIREGKKNLGGPIITYSNTKLKKCGGVCQNIPQTADGKAVNGVTPNLNLVCEMRSTSEVMTFAGKTTSIKIMNRCLPRFRCTCVANKKKCRTCRQGCSTAQCIV